MMPMGNRMINRDYVASSNITSVGYDQAAQTLEVEFKNGSIYQYFNVEQSMFDQLMASASKGQFLNTYIRSGYPYSRVG
jgi:KTSC domain